MRMHLFGQHSLIFECDSPYRRDKATIYACLQDTEAKMKYNYLCDYWEIDKESLSDPEILKKFDNFCGSFCVAMDPQAARVMSSFRENIK